MPDNFEIIEHIGVISGSATGWRKELNIARWYNNEPKYDIREISPDDEPKRGITLTENELEALKDLILSIDASVLQSQCDVTEEWEDTLEQIIDESANDFAEKCIEMGIPAPSTVGYELVDEDDDVIGEAEMAWETQKIVYLTPTQEEYESDFIDKGWQIIKTDDELSLSVFE